MALLGGASIAFGGVLALAAIMALALRGDRVPRAVGRGPPPSRQPRLPIGT